MGKKEKERKKVIKIKLWSYLGSQLLSAEQNARFSNLSAKALRQIEKKIKRQIERKLKRERLRLSEYREANHSDGELFGAAN